MGDPSVDEQKRLNQIIDRICDKDDHPFGGNGSMRTMGDFLKATQASGIEDIISIMETPADQARTRAELDVFRVPSKD